MVYTSWSSSVLHGAVVAHPGLSAAGGAPLDLNDVVVVDSALLADLLDPAKDGLISVAEYNHPAVGWYGFIPLKIK